MILCISIWPLGVTRQLFIAVLTLCALIFQTPAFAADQGTECVPLASWVDPATRETIAPEKLLRAISRKQAVLLGEQHDLAEHHRWQLQMITELYAINPDIVIGFEMFSRRVQPVLDRWVRGELTVDAFLQEVNWLQEWHYDPDLYLPLFHFARMNRIPMIALNIDKQLMARVHKQGWKNIPADERQGITDPAPASEDYIRLLATSFKHHSPSGDKQSAHGALGDDEKAAFARFVETQLLWDRAMADAIAAQLRNEPPAQVVAVMGSGHIISGFGVPHQLKAEGISEISTLIPWSHRHDCSELEASTADAVFGLDTEEQQPREKPQLGILMERREAGVTIVDVVENSVAAAAGLKPDDVITEIAGQPADGLQNIIEIVRAMVPGTWLPITVLRGTDQVAVIARFPPDNAK